MKQIHLVYPKTELRVLSHHEVRQLQHADSRTHQLAKRCCYAVLSAGSHGDDLRAFEQDFERFDIEFELEPRGLLIRLSHPPRQAFVDGLMIRGIREHLFSVLRDIIYAQDAILGAQNFDLSIGSQITNAIFHLTRNANLLKPNRIPRLVVCWGGHSIPRHEYEYCKEVGYHLGLRAMDIITGCGPGAMKGPMKGAAVGHAKQHIKDARYIGITEPGIIAAESPNPFVNELVIMPDIEKRLEAFVRLGHGIVIFPGGPGTAEELLYLLGILTHPENQSLPFPLILTGPAEAEAYLYELDSFIRATLGQQACDCYQLILNDPEEVAIKMTHGIQQVQDFRNENRDAYFFNWSLTIAEEFQAPFQPTHDALKQLKLSPDEPLHRLAGGLRRAFSAIVAGNVKPEAIQRVKEQGPFVLQGDPELMKRMDLLLNSMVAQGRMKIGGEYQPCYRLS